MGELLCDSGPVFLGGRIGTAARVSPQSVYDFQFRVALQRHRRSSAERFLFNVRPAFATDAAGGVPISHGGLPLHV